MGRERLSVAEVVHDAIANAYERLTANETAARTPDAADAIHQARVATRRLRSDLRTFEPWLDPDASASLRTELHWLGAELGAVRDLDVMRDRLRGHARSLPAPEADVAEHIVRRLDADREAARVELVGAFGQTRYAELHRQLERAALDPPCIAAAHDADARELRASVRDRWRRLRKAVDRLGSHPPDEALHHVRVRAKRCRYAAEAVAPAFGGHARAFVRAMTDLQDALGEHHDAVVARAWLGKTASECAPTEAYVLGMLAEIERRSGDDARAAFTSVWRDARRPRLRSWLHA